MASSGTGSAEGLAQAEWPDWTPPPEMIERQPYLPRWMAGGPGNPMGARALYLGATVYRIHGTNAPETIGHAVSSGCFRLVNDEVIDLYDARRGRHQGDRAAVSGARTEPHDCARLSPRSSSRKRSLGMHTSLRASFAGPHPEEAARACVWPSRRMAAHSVPAQSCLRPSFETHCGRQAADRNAPQDEGLRAIPKGVCGAARPLHIGIVRDWPMRPG